MDTLTLHRSNRIKSVDIVRGIIMIIMALDHVRDYTHVQAITGNPTDLATTTPILFMTRWVTHFCAPLFVFLSGISAWLNGRNKTIPQLSNFLIRRGLWLIIAEIVIVTPVMTFNPTFSFILLQVIWVIGWAMLILGLLVRAGYTVVAVTGIVLFFGHDLMNYVTLPPGGTARTIIDIFITTAGTVVPYGDGRILLFAYAILPWTGVMCLGYAFGKLFSQQTSPSLRSQRLLVSGLVLTGLFFLLRSVNQYGDPAPWVKQPDAMLSILAFLNVSKYPPSLQFCCMTIGPGLILLSIAERWKGKLVEVLGVYGKVPFFYFVGHFLLIHLVTVVLFFATGRTPSEIIDPASPFFFRPADFGFGLPVVYIIWVVVVVLMYFPCKWYMRYKATHDYWWLSYL